MKQFSYTLLWADFIIISFAEHNGSYTAAFKNIFDWTSRFVEDAMLKSFWILFDFTCIAVFQSVINKWKGLVDFCNLPDSSDLTAILVRLDQ